MNSTQTLLTGIALGVGIVFVGCGVDAEFAYKFVAHARRILSLDTDNAPSSAQDQQSDN